MLISQSRKILSAMSDKKIEKNRYLTAYRRIIQFNFFLTKKDAKLKFLILAISH